MLKLTVNSIVVFIHSKAEFENINYNPADHPGDYTKLDWSTSDKDAQIWFNVSSGFDQSRSWLVLAGHNVNEIDYAVPQDWWDQEYKRTGKGPRACWSYEKNHLFGEPLYWDNIVAEARRNIKVSFDEWLNQVIAIGDKKEKSE